MEVYGNGHPVVKRSLSIKVRTEHFAECLKNSVKKHFDSSGEKFKHKLRIYEKLVKILIEVKRSILIRILEFPVNMHNFRPLWICVTDLYH